MSCKHFDAAGTRQAEMSHEEPSETNKTSALVEALFQELTGSWILHRRLQSTNTSEPAGKCVGTATFTLREPSVFVGEDGKLDLAVAEMVYHEQGHFEMYQASVQPGSPRFQFSRKYVWRLQKQNAQQPAILSIWFTKPGTETVDYLFHKVNMMVEKSTSDEDASKINLHGNGGHLCVEDLYGSEYSFHFRSHGVTTHGADQMKLEEWKMLHEVRGPQKDQVIETNFIRSE